MIDLKKSFESGHAWEVHGFRFTKSETSFKQIEKRVFYTEVGVDDANSKGFAIEIGSDGVYTVWDVATKDRTEVQGSEPWSYDNLVFLLRKYGSLTGDVRDLHA
jgi:hypothetical protein